MRHPAHCPDSAGDGRMDDSVYKACTTCPEPSWMSDRHYLTVSSKTLRGRHQQPRLVGGLLRLRV